VLLVLSIRSDTLSRAQHPRHADISSQHVANWLQPGVVTEAMVRDSFTRMASLVDGAAFQASMDLVFKGKEQSSGCTEPLLHACRLKVNAC
jgi:malate synthase